MIFIDSDIKTALGAIEKNKKGLTVVVERETKTVCGVISDGDLRRAIISNATVHSPIKDYVNYNFIALTEGKADVADYIRLKDAGYQVVPLLNGLGQFLHYLDEQSYSELLSSGVRFRSKAPVRISFSGGGSDFNAFFSRSKYGAVFSAAINLFANVEYIPRQDEQIKVTLVDFGMCKTYQNAEELEAQLSSQPEVKLIYACLKVVKQVGGCEIQIWCDFSPGTGLGGSSAVVVALLSVLLASKNRSVSAHEIAALAYEAERVVAGVKGGWQDFYPASFGGFNFIEFKPTGIDVQGVRLSNEVIADLEASCLLIRLKNNHDSGAVHDRHEDKFRGGASDISLEKLIVFATQMRSELSSCNISRFGHLMHEAWLEKQKTGSISGDLVIDSFYSRRVFRGIFGGKVLGAGFGGYFLVLIDARFRFDIIKEISDLGYEYSNVQFCSLGVRTWSSRRVEG